LNTIIFKSLQLIALNAVDVDLFTVEMYNERLNNLYYTRSGMQKLIDPSILDELNITFKTDRAYQNYLNYYYSTDVV
jgi:hypothetical protein